MQISVIMPVYNIEKYLPEAIESILNQTLSDFELIILDDKSTDNTLGVAYEYADKDRRIRVIELDEHKKQGEGRNRGIEEAKGEYIMFLDGDDIAKPQFLEKMHTAIVSSESDICMCKFQTLDDKSKKISDNHPYGHIEVNEKMLKNGFSPKDIISQIFTIPNVVWNKIYKRSFLKNKDIKLPGVITICEDIIFGIIATISAEKIFYVDESLLLYRINRPNASSIGCDESFFDNFTMYEILEKKFKEIGIYEEIKKPFLMDAIYNLLYFFERIKPQYRKSFYKKMQEFYNDCYQKEFSTKEKCLRFDATTYFHLNRVMSNGYLKYMILNFIDKIFKIEKWYGGYAIVVFSKKEFWVDNPKSGLF